MKLLISTNYISCNCTNCDADFFKVENPNLRIMFRHCVLILRFKKGAFDRATTAGEMGVRFQDKYEPDVIRILIYHE